MKKIKILLTIAIFVVLLANDSNGVSAMEISSQCGILMEQSTGRVLYEKCPDDQMYIASITKILTTIVAIENANLDEWVEISDNVTRQVGSALYLTLGDQVKLIDLLYGLMLRSGNDAAMAIAEFVGGDEASFVKMMNDKASTSESSLPLHNRPQFSTLLLRRPFPLPVPLPHPDPSR